MGSISAGKIIAVALCLVMVLSVIALGDLSGYNFSNVSENIVDKPEIIWWNSTEFSTDPYTAPFFEIYKLKDFGQAAYGLATADFNDDGYLDFVVSWTTSPNNHTGISIFYGNNDRSFRVENIRIYKYEIEDLDTADFDNDGNIDIMCAREEGNDECVVNIFWNDNGSFERETQVAEFNRHVGYWDNVHVATADFDLDGDVDFIAGANCGKVKLFKNDGFGNFSTSDGYIFDYGYVSWGLDTGDFNHDGYPDFVVCADTGDDYNFTDAGHIYLKLNDKTNDCFNHSPGMLISSLPLPMDHTIGAMSFGTVAVLDYNNDGVLDVIYGGDWKIFLFMQQENGSFRPFYACGLRDREFTWIDYLAEGGFTVGDFNYDGLDDVVVGGANGVVRLFINNYTLVTIVKPEDRLIYSFGNDVSSMRFPGMTVVVGDIDVIAVGLEPLGRVDFYLNDKLIYSDSSEPFIWNWTKFSFGKYTVTAEAYDIDDQFAGKDVITVWKFL